ncbi:transforming growth factor-beta-induced protein ig-h3 [Nephila pilipes]|uniref:Transforming growth factor-beta-induced protein ig-h3 n=1 Tax=Nephila pilipes TaxID=299642 RepID=A0A8X6R8R2_NEPPI|nr:transforming growth factor-beta-induced protein ig-h3 [Nephila pilipes]
MPPIDLAVLNNLCVWESFLSISLGTLDGAIPISLLPHPSCRKPITLVTYSNEVLQDYKNICFTDGSKLNGIVGLACVMYEEGFEKATFQHRIRDGCSVFQAELLCINLAVKIISPYQD